MPVEHDSMGSWQEAIGGDVVLELDALVPDTTGWALSYVYEHDGHGIRNMVMGVTATMNSGRRIEATSRWACVIEDAKGTCKTETWHDRGTVEGIMLALGRR